MHWNPLIGRCATRARKDFYKISDFISILNAFSIRKIAQWKVLIGKCMKVRAVQGRTFNFFDDSLSSRQDASNILLHERICCAKFEISLKSVLFLQICPSYCCMRGLVVQNLKSKVNSQQMFIQNILMANYLFGAGSSALWKPKRSRWTPSFQVVKMNQGQICVWSTDKRGMKTN